MPAERTPKTATTTAKKASKKGKQDGQPKEKRPPSPYNLFVKEQMPIWKEANPGRPVKEAMQGVSVSLQLLDRSQTASLYLGFRPQIATLWADSDLNPNKGKPPKSKSKKTKSSTANDADEDQHTASSSVAGSSSAVPSSDHDY